MEIIMKHKGLIFQFLRFAMVGTTSIIVGYGAYAGTLNVLRFMHLLPDSDYFLAQVMMFVISVGWSFIWNNKLVFRKQEDEKRNLWLACVKTYASYALTSLLLSEILLNLWVNVLGVNAYLAPILSILITGPLNFLIQKFWAFRCYSVKRAEAQL